MRGGSRLPARRKLLDFWWAVLGSNQWPLPCETEVGCLRINVMRAVSPIATRTSYHVMSFDITQCHDPTVPKLSQTARSRPASGVALRSDHDFQGLALVHGAVTCGHPVQADAAMGSRPRPLG